MIKIIFVCHGNICRSTMAESICRQMCEQHHISAEIDSAATHYDAIGMGMYYPAREKLQEKKVPIGNHRARILKKSDYEYFDYIIGMDDENMYNIRRITGDDKDNKVYKLLTFAGKSRDVADPWYTGDFETTYQDLIEGLEAFLKTIE